jgi:phthiocerol/phenolphthiocerol synthesis type-I polyketide synthase C
MARDAALTERLKQHLGVRLLTSARALDRLEDALTADTGFAVLAELGWSSRLATLPAIATAPKYARVRELMSGEASAAAGINAEAIRAHLSGLPRDEAISAVQHLLVKHVAGVVGAAPARIAADQPLTDLGMDSLMLVELQIGLDKQFGIAIPTFELMDLATVEKLGRRIVDELAIAPACASPGEANEPSADPDAFADEPEPAFELMIGRLLEQQNSPRQGKSVG